MANVGDKESPSKNADKRSQTDESLRVERQRADVKMGEKQDELEDKADEIVRVARVRADAVVQTARDDADSERGPQSAARTATSRRERGQADAVLREERTEADAVLEQERAQRRRYLTAFLTVEREATDQDLGSERVDADTAITKRDDFLASVSHDLRALLGGLALNAQMLVRSVPPGVGGDKMRERADITGRMVARMDRLINDLLDVASIEAGKLAILPSRVALGQLLQETLDAFAPLAAKKDIALVLDAPASPLEAMADGERILQVLANLVSNAIKFTPPQGRIEIRMRSEGNEIHFAVSDTGPGIPADALTEVFERFRQLHPDRRGLGLGLHISKSLIEAHGGRMWAESVVGTGSTFHFSLPALR